MAACYRPITLAVDQVWTRDNKCFKILQDTACGETGPYSSEQCWQDLNNSTLMLEKFNTSSASARPFEEVDCAVDPNNRLGLDWEQPYVVHPDLVPVWRADDLPDLEEKPEVILPDPNDRNDEDLDQNQTGRDETNSVQELVRTTDDNEDSNTDGDNAPPDTTPGDNIVSPDIDADGLIQMKKASKTNGTDGVNTTNADGVNSTTNADGVNTTNTTNVNLSPDAQDCNRPSNKSGPDR